MGKRKVAAKEPKADLVIERIGPTIWLTSPFDSVLVSKLRDIGSGRWDKVKRKWYFPHSKQTLLQAVCFEVFGKYPVVVTVEEEVKTEVAWEETMKTEDDTTKLKPMTDKERGWMFAHDLAAYMSLFTDEEKEIVYELLFMQKKET